MQQSSKPMSFEWRRAGDVDWRSLVFALAAVAVGWALLRGLNPDLGVTSSSSGSFGQAVVLLHGDATDGGASGGVAAIGFPRAMDRQGAVLFVDMESGHLHSALLPADLPVEPMSMGVRMQALGDVDGDGAGDVLVFFDRRSALAGGIRGAAVAYSPAAGEVLYHVAGLAPVDGRSGAVVNRPHGADVDADGVLDFLTTPPDPRQPVSVRSGRTGERIGELGVAAEALVGTAAHALLDANTAIVYSWSPNGEQLSAALAGLDGGAPTELPAVPDWSIGNELQAFADGSRFAVSLGRPKSAAGAPGVLDTIALGVVDLTASASEMRLVRVPLAPGHIEDSDRITSLAVVPTSNGSRSAAVIGIKDAGWSACVSALDLATGELLWHEAAGMEQAHFGSAIVPGQLNGRGVVLVSSDRPWAGTRNWVQLFDAESGAELWRVEASDLVEIVER